MNTMNVSVNKWVGSLLILAALAVYIIFQTRIAVMTGVVLLAAGIIISLLTIPREQRIQRAAFYIVAIPVFYFIRAFM
ncbi:hypothetical protein [Paenibacillus bovis]|uniref:Uncharacterized protein n=1 Tax=Paenibacillus bovis TaxID=1616788 RepID=A0A172ZER4_9BACL|nr:hypothetical protein [Paenibacillus bovis]ANF95777.1 hypothetical protein AR543_07010 [Paenibacillus bovis]